MSDNKGEFLSEIHNPTTYATCKLCGKSVNETSMSDMMNAAGKCGKGECPYSSIHMKDIEAWD
jgi:hypothetical protein